MFRSVDIKRIVVAICCTALGVGSTSGAEDPADLNSTDVVSEEQHDSVVDVKWVLPTTEFQPKKTFHAWLLAQYVPVPKDVNADNAPASEASNPTLSLHAAKDVTAWFATTAKCEANPPEADQSRTNAVYNKPTTVCVQSASRRTFRLVAFLESTDERRPIIAAESQKLEPVSWLTIGPASLAILTALLGFLLGLGSHLLQRGFDHLLERRRTKSQLKKTVTELIAPDWLENSRRLELYLADVSATAPTLLVKAYEALLGDEGALAFLEEERQSYWRKYKVLYDRLKKYNRIRGDTEKKDEIRHLATEIQGVLRSVNTHTD